MDHATVLNILKKEKRYPWKVNLIQEHQLQQDDFDLKIEFCESIMKNSYYLWCSSEKNIFFSDEAILNINSLVNRQTCVYWVSESPY